MPHGQMSNYNADRLDSLSQVMAALACAEMNLKRAHARTPEACGPVRSEIHALVKLTDALRMRIHDRIVNAKGNMT